MQDTSKPDEAQIFKIQLPRTQNSRRVSWKEKGHYKGSLILPFLTGYLIPEKMYTQFNAMLRMYMFLPLTEQLYDLLNIHLSNQDMNIRYTLECQKREDNITNIWWTKEERKDVFKRLGILKSEAWRLYIPLTIRRQTTETEENIEAVLQAGLPPQQNINNVLKRGTNPFTFSLGTFEKEVPSACYSCTSMLDNLAGHCTPGTGSCFLTCTSTGLHFNRELTSTECAKEKDANKLEKEIVIWDQILKSLNLLLRT